MNSVIIQLHVRLVQAINAALYGVIGMLVYTDPEDVNDGLMSDINETYPHSWYMPPSGMERGTFKTILGDLLTPYMPAKGKQQPVLLHRFTYFLYMNLWSASAL